MKKREKQLKNAVLWGRRTLERVEKVKSKLKTPKATKNIMEKVNENTITEIEIALIKFFELSQDSQGVHRLEYWIIKSYLTHICLNF